MMSADFVSLAWLCCRCVSCSRRVAADGANCELCCAVEAAYSVGGTRAEAAGAGLGLALAADGTERDTVEATSDPSLRAGLDDDEPMMLRLWPEEKEGWFGR